ncbi:MAG: rhomboid family intramembrane serine protease [Opitutales bacterium]
MASEKNDVAAGTETAALDLPEGWVPVAVYARREAAQEAGLVILAMGQAYWLLPDSGQFVLCVRDRCAGAVEAELDEVAKLRRRRRPRRSIQVHEFRPRVGSFLFYGLILILMFGLQGSYPLVDAGRVDAVAVMAEGELWRVVTALTLHADVVHLVSNLVAGAGFAFFVARFFGAAAGWFLILLSGMIGNLLNAWVYYPEPHFSIGASTAVFAALGLMTGVGSRLALADSEGGWMLPRWLLPAFGGLTLLGLLGVGEGPVDVAAHISGFLCGIGIGFIGALRQSFFVRIERYRFATGFLGFSLLALAWWAALSG